MTHKKMVCIVANDIGAYHRPQVYQLEIIKRYGVNVSSSSIVKALGAYSKRRLVDTRIAEQKASMLLHTCYGDKFQAKSLIEKLAAI